MLILLSLFLVCLLLFFVVGDAVDVVVGDGQGSLACCSPWGLRVGHD